MANIQNIKIQAIIVDTIIEQKDWVRITYE